MHILVSIDLTQYNVAFFECGCIRNWFDRAQLARFDLSFHRMSARPVTNLFRLL